MDGTNWHCQVICNPLYTAYFTTGRKDRLTGIDVLRNRRKRVFRLNDEALALLRRFGVSGRTMEQLRNLPWDQELCWIHDGRHYKNLEPCLACHRPLLDAFLKRYWDYYKELLAYRQQPSAEEAMRLSGAFDELFSTATGYAALDQRLARTQAHKGHLTDGAAASRDPVAQQPRRVRGTGAGAQTGGALRAAVAARSPVGHLSDPPARPKAGTFPLPARPHRWRRQLPSLADLIHQRAKDLQLGSSWEPS